MAGFGGAVKLTGEQEYRSALKNITQNLREVSSQLQMTATGYETSDKSIKDLSKTHKEMNSIYTKQQSEVDKLKSAYDSFSQKVQQQAKAHSNLEEKYENEVAKLDRIRNSLGIASKEYQDQKQKVDDLQKSLVKSKQENDNNANALSKMGTALNKAETDLMKTAEQMDNLGKETKEAGEGFTVFKGVLSNLISNTITSAISGLKKLGDVTLEVGKQALESYADYEQLVGGVDTLFKESSNTVQKYAENAYKTAGLSANEYMETVTGFSASLLQSLDNDTAKTAEYADMAITDMADNANKMGTSMELIQNAYQGFAKQNYTMLDNLKLGYGGTQTEMVRLINDSGILNKKIKDLDGISFAQIIQAIHKVQDNMGITGTTAKEASETISGSTASMKSAWQNLLVGIADENKDFGKLLNQFIDSVLTTGDNIIPRVKQIVKGIKKLVTNVVNDIFPRLKREIPELKPLIETFEWFIDNRTKVTSAIKVMVSAFAVSKIVSFTKTISDTIKSIAAMVVTTQTATSATNANTTAQVANTTAQVAGTTATNALAGATTLLNNAWKANPVGLVVTGVTALISVVSLLKKDTEELTEAEKQQQFILEQQTEQIQENKDAWEDLKKTQQNSVNANMTELSYYDSLYDELQNIVDANGKVKDGYEERASFITSTLSEALGIEIQTVNGVIKKYGDLKNSIDEVMQQKKAQIILDSQESMYKEAIESQNEALKLLIDTEAHLTENKAERAKLEAELQEKELQYHSKFTDMSNSKRYEMAREIQTIKEKMTAIDTETANLQTNYDTQKDLVSEYAYNIGLYEQNMALAHAGKYDEMTQVNWDYVKNYQGAGEAEKAMLEDQIKTTEYSLNLLKSLKDKSGKDIYDSQIASSENQLAQLKESLKKYNSVTEQKLEETGLIWNDTIDDTLSVITGSKIEFQDAGNDTVQMYANGIKIGEPKSKQEMAKLVENTVKEISNKEPMAKVAGENLINGLNSGVSNPILQSSVFRTVNSFGNSILANLKSSLQEHSPSKATNEMGQFLLKGLGLGIDKEEKSVLNQVSGLGKNILSNFRNGLNGNEFKNNISAQLQNAVPTNIDASINGITAKKSNNQTNMVEAIKKALKEVKVVMNDREMGTFVADTMERVVYS